ncbi:putative component of membrane protein insertase Oxa1/YidC/SpoIIIJ protein YidD [Flavobacterium sp. HSC-32F16]|uniref:membrane protein insertion efficiency factor YidD n=1 Tax=Flavobacterium sp. HSC-32F16 TaxID=2910964 RepID=UPI0020A28757|nr:membrane protein insertion efficiency factor YidD [Flavobacterium sp. HSC-32F16]MCP2027783.1 putative component of membrane protein insertase Oxa1/YidC/SpoIIIJ protein YidD [Flavobacterium sp. HSC-32F16]
MKYFILLIIRLYWIVIPSAKRRKCIFRKSCSNYVFEATQQDGFINAIKAFWFRYKNCRTGFQIFKNPITNDTQMILPSQIIIDREEIAERLIQ